MTVGLAPRAAALEAIRAVDEGAWSTTAVVAAIATLDDPRDRALAAHLAHGTIRWRGSLDWALDQVLTRDLEHVERRLVPILRLGAFQLLHSRVPDRAAVDTAVALAADAVPARRQRGTRGFVNGVLRGLARRRDELQRLRADLDDEQRIALETGHPAWIVRERLRSGMPPAEVERLLHADNDSPGVTLRVDGDRDEVAAELAEAGIATEPTALSPRGLRAPGLDPRTSTVVAEGRAVPQDEASMLVAEAVVVAEGGTVVDLCAAPGGKATALAHRVGPDGRVVAVDLHDHRARLVAESAERQDVAVEVVVGDARTVDLPHDVDAVLVDAPCTGLGVGRRRPEVRWNRTPADANDLARLQGELLDRAISLVRPGGHVTYSVCTWTTAETIDVVAAIEARHGARLARIDHRQLRPDVDGTDGMFLATWAVDAPG